MSQKRWIHGHLWGLSADIFLGKRFQTAVVDFTVCAPAQSPWARVQRHHGFLGVSPFISSLTWKQIKRHIVISHKGKEVITKMCEAAYWHHFFDFISDIHFQVFICLNFMLLNQKTLIIAQGKINKNSDSEKIIVMWMYYRNIILIIYLKSLMMCFYVGNLSYKENTRLRHGKPVLMFSFPDLYL